MNCTMILLVDTIDIKSRSILVKEIPLGTSKEAIQAHFQDFGSINKITWSVVGLWQKATIEFKEKEAKEKEKEPAKVRSHPRGRVTVRRCPSATWRTTKARDMSPVGHSASGLSAWLIVSRTRLTVPDTTSSAVGRW